MEKQTLELTIRWQIGDLRAGDGWHKTIEIPRRCSWLQAVKLMKEAIHKDKQGRCSSFLTNIPFTEKDWKELIKTGKFSRKKDDYNFLRLSLFGDVVFQPLTIEERLRRIEQVLGLE